MNTSNAERPSRSAFEVLEKVAKPLFRESFASFCALPPVWRLRHYTVAALRFPRPFRRANRAASSKTVRCFRRRRRFTVFHSAQSVFSDAHAPGRLLLPLCGNSPSVVRKNGFQFISRLRTPGQPLAALPPYGCRVPLAGKTLRSSLRKKEPLFERFLFVSYSCLTL